MHWIIIILLCIISFGVWASADIGSGVYLKTLCRRRTDKPVVAITFDDGPDADRTPEVLTILRQYNVKAAFFLVGSKIEKNPELVAHILSEGHCIGNHTYTHSPLFPLKSRKKVTEEIADTQTAIEKTTGYRPLLFRPPFGVTNPIIGKVIRKTGLYTIGWSIRSLDTVKSRSRQAICNHIKRKLHNGAVILLHDRCPDAAELTRLTIESILAAGYKIITISELFNIQTYEK